MASFFLTANSEQHLHTWGESVDQQWCFSTRILVLAWSRSTLRLHDPFQHNIYFSSHIPKPSVQSHPCYTHSLTSYIFVSHLSKSSIHITFAVFLLKKTCFECLPLWLHSIGKAAGCYYRGGACSKNGQPDRSWLHCGFNPAQVEEIPEV